MKVVIIFYGAILNLFLSAFISFSLYFCASSSFPRGLLETVEENQNEVPNAKSIGTRRLESQGISQ